MKPVFRPPSLLSWIAATVLLAAALCCFLLPVYWVRGQFVVEHSGVAGQLSLLASSESSALREWPRIVARQVVEALSRGIRAMLRDTVRVFRQTAVDGRQVAARVIRH